MPSQLMEVIRFVNEQASRFELPRDKAMDFLEALEESGCIALKGPASPPEDFRLAIAKINDGLSSGIRSGQITPEDVLRDCNIPVTFRNLRRINTEIGKYLRLTDQSAAK